MREDRAALAIALKDKCVHFVGIGGSGMSGLARIMLAQGIAVSGSDIKESTALTTLENLGAKIFVGHHATNIDGADLLVTSGAINESNPEVKAARENQIQIITRAQALALLMADTRSVAVAGTHGKTTTTSMLTVALQSAGLDPSFAIGGMINSSGVNAHQGTGDVFVAEADESDGSFVVYHPLGAIITNIELDHVDHFSSLDAVYEVFLEFVSTIRSGGFLIACGDDAGVIELLKRVARTDIAIFTYGTGDCDFQISRIHMEPLKSFARVSKNGKILPELTLAIPGEHNIFNAVAALAAGMALGVDAGDLIEGLSRYSGSRRRFERKGSVAGVDVIDDYGHHPTEITVVLETARRYVGSGKIRVLFQPHRYSRTQAFAHEFAQALSLADEVYVLDIYAASELPIPGVSSLLITREMAGEKAHFEPSMVDAVRKVVSASNPGDLVITLGAGDVSSLAPVIVQELEEKNLEAKNG
jgi:UDP-N-acetylmuramate--alanine ligase